jgi:hypothetical protein
VIDWTHLALAGVGALVGVGSSLLGVKLLAGKPPAPKSTWDGIDADIDARRKK